MAAIVTIDRTQQTGILKGNGSVVSSATAGVDYSVGTSALTTGILKSTTGTGALSIAASGTDFSPGTAFLITGLVKSTTGTGALTIGVAGTDFSMGTASLATGLVKSTTATGALTIAVNGTDFTAGTASLATGIMKNTTATGAVTIAVNGTDYSAGTASLATGLLKSTTATGALTIAAAADIPAIGSTTQITYNNAGVMSGSTFATLSTSTINGSTQSLQISNSSSQTFMLYSNQNLSSAFPIATFAPNSSTNTMALDIIPNGSPTDNSFSNAVAWIDILNADYVNQRANYSGLRLGAGTTYSQVGSSAGGTGTVLPLLLQKNGSNVGIGSTLPYTSGGLLAVAKSNVYTSEGSAITIDSGSNGKPELIFGVDTTNSMAFLQSASRGTNFTSYPLVLNPNSGGKVGIGNNTAPSFTLDVTGTIRGTTSVISGGIVRTQGYTVAQVNALTSVIGDRAYCTDLLTPSFLTIIVGGGAVVGPVFYNGSAWVGG